MRYFIKISYLAFILFTAITPGHAEVILVTDKITYFKPSPKVPYVCRLAPKSARLGTISTNRIRPGKSVWTRLSIREEKQRLRSALRQARTKARLLANKGIPLTSPIQASILTAQKNLDAFMQAKAICLQTLSDGATKAKTPNPTRTPAPTPTCSYLSCGNPPVLTHWPVYLDEDETVWQSNLEMLKALKQLGYTHAGVTLGYNGIDISSRVKELRDRGFKLALHNSSGHIILNNPNRLDPQKHSSNGQNLKYFDTPGFNPYSCASDCGGGEYGPNCSLKPYRLAHDPAYTGTLWQEELTILRSKLSKSTLQTGDAMLFDTELWGPTPALVDYCYPETLAHSTGRYSGTITERQSQYFRNWWNRAMDLKTTVKNHDADVLTLFYNENIPENIDQTWIPPGVGDAPSPRFYFAPNLDMVAEALGRGNYNGTYVWISFSNTSSSWAHPPGSVGSSGWITTVWDPIITQKMGVMLKRAGVTGIVVYPGPAQHGLTKDYFYQHSIALVRGFYIGIDPGTLIEKCADGMDNDGDGEFDENCPS